MNECVCVRACVRICVYLRASVRACVCACLLLLVQKCVLLLHFFLTFEDIYNTISIDFSIMKLKTFFKLMGIHFKCQKRIYF